MVVRLGGTGDAAMDRCGVAMVIMAAAECDLLMLIVVVGGVCDVGDDWPERDVLMVMARGDGDGRATSTIGDDLALEGVDDVAEEALAVLVAVAVAVVCMMVGVRVMTVVIMCCCCGCTWTYQTHGESDADTTADTTTASTHAPISETDMDMDIDMDTACDGCTRFARCSEPLSAHVQS